jgi:DNA topoisomerase IA
MKREEIISEINKVFSLRLFYGLKRILYEIRKEKISNTEDFKNLSNQEKSKKLKKFRDKYFKDSEYFYLNLHSIFAIYPLFKREKQIRAYDKEEITRIKADYIYKGIEFSAQYPTAFKKDMQKEIQDTIAYLKDKEKNLHIVDTYLPVKDYERKPKEPLTNAEIKFSAFYLFNFQADETTKYLKYLYFAGLISNPDTDGWEIPDDFAEEMITILNQVYNIQEVLQYKRRFVDSSNDRSKEAIRPIKVSMRYFPKNLENLQEFNNIKFESKEDLINTKKLYEFIFYITLSTQMNNSIYDRSRVVIIVGNKKLTAEANLLIKGQENWEKLTGSFISKLNDSNDKGNNIVEIPELKNEQILEFTNIYPYDVRTKRPPRYGTGRFITQILEKNKIGRNEEHDLIVKNLKDSKAVIEIEKMLYPQEQTYFCMEWIEENIPSLVDLEYLTEIEEKIHLIERKQLTIESLKNEINLLIDYSFKKVGYIEEDIRPNENKIKLLNAIAKKYNLKIAQSVYSSNAQIELILSQYPVEEIVQVGTCPKCNSTVFQREYIDNNGDSNYYYSCENFSKDNKGCNFSIWDSKIYTFFSTRNIETHTQSERAEIIKKILSKKAKGYLFDGFIKATGEGYSAYVKFNEYPNKLKNNKLEWGFELTFPRKRIR